MTGERPQFADDPGDAIFGYGGRWPTRSDVPPRTIRARYHSVYGSDRSGQNIDVEQKVMAVRHARR